ncbi:TPA: pyrroline-5-carboxylate reductase, partial [Neisseria gonorrhoeae]
HEAVEAFRRHRVAEAISEGVCACVCRSQEMERQYQ